MKSWMRTFFVVGAMTGVCTAGPMQGKSQGRGQSGNKQGNVRTESVGLSVSTGQSFGNVEVRLIREWFSDKRNLSGLPPGLAKKESLPPGLAKQLRKNGSLPPGLQKKIQPLPPALEVRLPRLPDDRRRVVISGSIILMDRKNTIIDVMANVY